MSPRCGPVLRIVSDTWPKVRAVLDEDRRSVLLYKETHEGHFLTGPLDNPQIQAVDEHSQPPTWLHISERDAVAIRDALEALRDTPPVEPEPVTRDERERYLRIIERLAGAGEAA